MLSYEVLDRIADSHNPALGLLWIAVSLMPLRTGRWQVTVARLALGLACLLCAYGYMWLDDATPLWARVGLDYSTHTGVAVALAAAILAASRRLGMLACALIALYVPLMVYQGYHAFSDIVTSAVAVGLPTWALVLASRRWTGTGPKVATGDMSKSTTRNVG